MEHSAKDILNRAMELVGEFTEENTEILDKPMEFKEPLSNFEIPESEYMDVEPEVVEEVQVEEPIVTEVVEQMPALYTPPQQEMVTYDPVFVDQMEQYSKLKVQATTYNKFADIPSVLRDPNENLDPYEIKKLNLATAIEILEQASQSYQSFPTADAAMAISTLSNQVHKLTNDLEKSNDPRKLYYKLEEEFVRQFSLDLARAVLQELKYLQEQSDSLVVPTKKDSFKDLFKEIASKRMTTAVNEVAERSKGKLKKVLGIKGDV